MTRGVAKVVAGALAATAFNRKEAAFMRSFAKAVFRASRKRSAAEKVGEHIPPFLIASITGRCNLHCAGCYSRANHACGDREPEKLLSAEEWDRIFSEARELGVSFILLAGGEPCPFSPYSDCSVRDSSIREALRSPLFYALNAQGLLKDDHAGGCTLFANREQVEAILN